MVHWGNVGGELAVEGERGVVCNKFAIKEGREIREGIGG